jgi:hypothetical protein
LIDEVIADVRPEVWCATLQRSWHISAQLPPPAASRSDGARFNGV